ncbi:MAG: bifunctional nuclease family protein [Planctomycetia bacterium]|nr:bifunctional nuclease family protein [Planctomycetia bacterium]
MTVQVIPSRVVICELNPHQAVFLREKNGGREFPIILGLFEATIIDRKIRQLPSSRPLTHDLLYQAIVALDGNLIDVVINRVEKQTFFAQIHLQLADRHVFLDARPSDAIALAVTVEPNLAIYVTEDVLEQALKIHLP